MSSPFACLVVVYIVVATAAQNAAEIATQIAAGTIGVVATTQIA